MNIARTWAQLTTRAVKYETGNIANEKQAKAFEEAQAVVAQADQVATSMLAQDNSAFDLNSELKGNVYLSKQNPSKFLGHCTSDSKGNVDRLEAKSTDGYGSKSLSVSVNGDHKSIHSVRTVNGKGCELVEEKWVIFDGSKASYKCISY